MLTIITHFPLLHLQLPGSLTLFMKEFLNVLRLQDLNLQRIFIYYGITDQYDKAYLSDRGYNIYFEQLGYNSRYIIFNCTVIIILLAIWTVLCIFTGLYEAIKAKKLVINGQIQTNVPTFGQNGRVKQYKSNSFHVAVQGLTRILQVSFIEVFLFTLVNIGKFGNNSSLSKTSTVFTVAFIWIYTCFFLSYPIYRYFVQQNYNVQSKIKLTKAQKRQKRIERKRTKMLGRQNTNSHSPIDNMSIQSNDRSVEVYNEGQSIERQQTSMNTTANSSGAFAYFNRQPREEKVLWPGL